MRLRTLLHRIPQLILISLIAATALLINSQPSRAVTYSVLHTFNSLEDGYSPIGDDQKPILASDGNFYGTTTYGGTNNLGTVYQMTTAGVVTTLYNFVGGSDGDYPRATLIVGLDGKLYGTASSGGANGYGTIFKIKTDGTAYATVLNFDYSNGGANNGPAYPYCGVVQTADGKLYGSTLNGGTSNYGTLYKVNTDGTGFVKIHDFNNTDGRGLYYTPIISGTTIYGASLYGGANSYGCIFSISTTGTGYADLHDFANVTTDGRNASGMLLGADGKLYGVAYYGGANNYGCVWKMSTTGTGFALVHSFVYNTDGANPDGNLIQDSTGLIYGTTVNYGTDATSATGQGTVWKVNTSGSTFTVLHTFLGSAAEGYTVCCGLVLSSANVLYGTRENGGLFNEGTFFSVKTGGGSFTLVYQFGNRKIDGTNPYYGDVVFGPDGTLYGTTVHGARDNQGAVYSIDTTGREDIVTGIDGNAYGGLLFGSDGNLYGTTYQGGVYGAGTAFQLSTAGDLNVFFNFGGVGGANLPSGLVVGADGALYGATYYGGQHNVGAIVRIALDGTEQLLYSFKGGTTDGAYPNGGMLLGSDGNFYGTTYQGGATNVGTIFKFVPGGAETIMRSFVHASDGSNPYSGLIEGLDGKLYGTTSSGGTIGGGTVFSIAKAGTGFKVIHPFITGASTSDGYLPYDGVLQGSDGKIYGTTYYGGANNVGSVFSMTTTGGGFKLLHSFANSGADGYNPVAGVTEGPDGNMYGTTYYGGVLPHTSVSIQGIVYEIATALPLISSFSPTSGPVGTVVTINGANFKSITKVTFNGKAATTFTLNSSSKITATVPTGATTGVIKVTSAGITCTSAKVYTVH